MTSIRRIKYRTMQQFVGRFDKENPVDEFDAKQFAYRVFGDTTPDGCKLSEVDWKEIAGALQEEATA
jgi:hypothetical protein